MPSERVRESREGARRRTVCDKCILAPWNVPCPHCDAFLDALIAAVRCERDAEWRAAVERVRREVPDTIDGVCQVCGRYSSYCPCFDHNAALDALLTTLEATDE